MNFENLIRVQPREFFIEDRLERFRLEAKSNLGESGIRNFDLGTLLDRLGMDASVLRNLSLADSPNQGSYPLRLAISELYDSKPDPESILITTGTSEALYLFFSLFCKPGDQVSLFWPAFQALYEIPLILGAKLRKIPVFFADSANRSLDWNEIQNPKDRICIVNHPHNPSGFQLSETFLEEYRSESKNRDTIFLWDEHYRFLGEGENLLPSGFIGNPIAKKCFATGSITKCFGVVGLKIGWILGDPDSIRKMRSFKDYLTHTVNPISEFLALEILKNRVSLLRPIQANLKRNLDLWRSLSDRWTTLEEVYAPPGGLVCFPKLKSGIRSEEYADRLYRDTGVFILPGINFEEEGRIRVGFGESPDRFQSGVLDWVEWDRSQYVAK